MQRIYLDHNATTPLHPEVREAMMPYMTEYFGNGSSIHAYGREARNAIDTAREQVADLIGAKSPSEIVFTSCGTEADNYAVKGIATFQKKRNGNNHIITSSVEHHAVLHTCQHLEKHGFEMTYLPVDRYGRIRIENLSEAIRDTSILVSIMHANNENGTIQPIEEICEIAGSHGIPVHTDAVQSVGKLPVDVQELGGKPAHTLGTQILRTQRHRRPIHSARVPVWRTSFTAGRMSETAAQARKMSPQSWVWAQPRH